MIDTHCHIIPKFDFNNPEQTISNAISAGVNKFIAIGCDFPDIEEVFILKKAYPEQIFLAVGLHPECVQEDSNIDEMWLQFYEIVMKNKDEIFAIGECGLDYHYANKEIEETAENIHIMQRDLFRRHIELSIETDKPLVIHTRDAWEDTFSILDEFDVKNKKTNHHVITDRGEFPNMNIDMTCGVIHSFTGGVDEAKKSIERGFKLGINGIVTFKNKTAEPIREAVKFAGKENIVFETDSPFLSPEPYRGARNEPARIKDIAEFVEQLLS